MPLQALLVFFLILYLRKRVRTFAPSNDWYKKLTLALYAVVALFILATLLHAPGITKWVWHILLLVLIGIMYKNQVFSFARMVLLALAPAEFVFLVSDVIESFFQGWYEPLKIYLHFGVAIATTWMVALLILSNRQRKAALKEQVRRQEEEQRNRIITARKEELEQLVIERTAALRQQKEALQQALTDLQATQTQLIHREKMASLGELTAGIAHEIQNPLNFITNFSELNIELVNELTQETSHLPESEVTKQTFLHILSDLQQNEQKIKIHGKRADAIVKGMLQHSRKSTGQKEATDVNALVDENLQLAYHTFRARDKSFNAKFVTDFDVTINKVSIVPQDISRVLLNLFNNAFYAVHEQLKKLGTGYEPTIWVNTKRLSNKVEISVKDNGMGISESLLDKIFQPFFTTKPTGQGTGLGLSLSYDIIKAHGGELKVMSTEGEGAVFWIELPA